MAFEMVDRDGRDPQCVGQAAPQRRAGQQGADQTGARGVGHAIQLACRGVGLCKCLTDKGKQPLHMVARGQFRHHAAVQPVQVHLAEQLVREQAAV